MNQAGGSEAGGGSREEVEEYQSGPHMTHSPGLFLAWFLEDIPPE